MITTTRVSTFPIAAPRVVSRLVALHGLMILGGLLFVSTARAEEATPETMFNNACRTCHSTKAGDNRLGPNLNAIVGRKSGAADGFAYSAAMKQANVTWDEANLDKFITNPDSVVPANNMKPFTGISDAAQRQGIIEFLKAGGKD